MSKKVARKKKKAMAERSGFTIIEVVLVLAIAGLIFLMVFIALPTLQRAQRDTQRRNDLARVGTALTQFQTNNNGRLPSAGSRAAIEEGDEDDFEDCGSSNSACTLIRNYLNGVNAANNEFLDPDGWAYGLTIAEAEDTEIASPSFDHVIYVYTHAACGANETVGRSQNSRDYAITYKLEGSGTYCSDNGGTVGSGSSSVTNP